MSNLFSTIHIGIDTPENDELIAQSGRIPLKNLRISAAVLFAFAAVAVILRTIRRLILFRRLKLDDAFVWFAVFCLSAAAGCFIDSLFILILEDAIPLEPDVIVPINQVSSLLNSISIIDAFLCTIWTCIFAVKGSFLALFWHLIQGLSTRITKYYWFVVGYTSVIWLFLVVEPFILCPHFGLDGAKCYPEDKYFKTFDLTIIITILDIMSDIMIASIPILILRKSRTKLKQKFSLGLFLCLSLIIAIFALIRIIGLKNHGVLDNTWQLFWQYCEGCVACVMASITPFRTLFVAIAARTTRKRTGEPTDSPRKFSNSLRQLLWKKHTRKRSNEADWIEMGSENPLPRPPAALLSGLRTFIRRNNRDSSLGTVTITNTFDMESVTESPEQEYQNYLRKATALPQIPESGRTGSGERSADSVMVS